MFSKTNLKTAAFVVGVMWVVMKTTPGQKAFAALPNISV